MDEISMSPVPQKKIEIQMTFGEAMREVILGHKIRSLAWPADEYGALVDGWLIVHRQAGVTQFESPAINHRWLVSESDMMATDWIVKEENN